MTWRQAIVSALAYSSCAQAAGSHPTLAAPYNDAARFVEQELAAMPDHLGLALRLATFAFDLSALAWWGRRFHRLSHERRLKHLQRWERSPLPPCRDLARFYQSLSVYALYSRLEAGS